MQENQTSDIIIFTNGNLFSRIILDKFIKKYHFRIAKVVIVTGDYYGNKGIKALYKFSKVTSWIYVIYKIWTILLIKLLPIGNKPIIASVEKFCDSAKVPYLSIGNINENSFFEEIKKLSPEYLVSVSCPQLIRKKWLDLVNNKGINIHSSLLPKYGGLAPYFWVLVNDERETGISVHYLVKGFDKGNVLAQEKVAIEKGESSFNLFLKLCHLGQTILVEAFEKMERDNPGTEQNLSEFTYFSHPTSSAYLKLKQKGFSLFNFKDFSKVKNYINRLEQEKTSI